MKTEDTTAYALGELHGSEREEFEKELAGSPELQSELAAMNALVEALAIPPSDDLGDTRRARLLAKCRSNLAESRRRRSIRKIVFATSLTALAACLLIAPMLPWTAYHIPALKKADFAGEAGGFVADREKTIAIACPPASAPVRGTAEALVPAAPASHVTALVASTGNVSPSFTMSPMIATPGTPQQIAVAGAATAGLAANGGASIQAFTSGWAKGSGTGDRSASVDPSAPAARGSAALAKGGVPADGRLFRSGAAPVAAQTNFNTEAYDAVPENAFLDAKANPLSTFSIDVDTASYANVRRFLNSEQLPPSGAVRIEELVNYFPYSYPQPDGDIPFSVNVETARAPWAPEHELVRIGIKGRELDAKNRPASNLVFLVDVSGSMQPENKLPLLRRSLRALVENLGPQDRVAIAVYAGSSGLVLPSTPGSDKRRILDALDHLGAGGSTNGAQGIKLAYETARENFLKDGNNRVILCTDGDFNVGVTSQSSLVELIEKERASGVFLSVLGFGDGNLKDSTMEKLADKGNGNYSYIDSFTEGRKVLVEQMGGTLFTIAKDVKIQVEFNPARVAGYRLIGYENRLLAKEDFNNDKKDAGEIGAGHSVTALYEVVPAGKSVPGENSVDPLKYQAPPPQEAGASDDLLTLKLRYKAPDSDSSKLIESPLKATDPKEFEAATPDFQFAAAVAAFGMKLRGTPGADDIAWRDIQAAAKRSLGEDPGSYRAEFLTLVEKAKHLTGSR
jgi:Ca-activated chloride channel family protein